MSLLRNCSRTVCAIGRRPSTVICRKNLTRIGSQQFSGSVQRMNEQGLSNGSSGSDGSSGANKTTIEEGNEPLSDASKTLAPAEDIPWYLRPEESSPVVEISRPMPELPDSPPQELEGIVSLMHHKLGIDNIKVFDKREQDDLEEVGRDLLKSFIVLGTGKSDKHLQKATIELMNYIKHDLGHERMPKVEGFTKTLALIRKEKKLRRKLKKNTGYHFEDYGVPVNSWIMVDTGVGNMNVHLVTEKRREELNLELLWCDPEDKHLYKRVRKPLVSDSIFSGLRRYHTWCGLPRTAMWCSDVRSYSTTRHTSEELVPFIARLEAMSIAEAQELISAKDSGSFVAQFNQLSESTPDSFRSQFKFHKLLHQISPSVYSFNELERLMLTEIGSETSTFTCDDLIEYFVALLESPSVSANSRTTRVNRMLSVLTLDDEIFLDWEVKLAPYLLSLFSNFNRPGFVTPKLVLDNMESFDKFEFGKSQKYHKQCEAIYELLRSSSRFDFLDESSQLTLLMVLAIYGNAKQYGKFYKVLDHLGSENAPWDFVISYIYKTGTKVEYSEFVDKVYPKINRDTAEFSELFQTYLELMKRELANDEFPL